MLFEMKEKQLPEEMQGMNARQRKDHIRKMKKKREVLQSRINKLNRERRRYVHNERKKHVQDNTLDKAIITTLQEQARMKNFDF